MMIIIIIIIIIITILLGSPHLFSPMHDKSFKIG
jgi:hypothetical protein